MALLRRGPRISLVLAALCLSGISLFAHDGQATETQLKAALVYNFANFTEWLDVAPGSALVIGVLGNDAVATALQASTQLANGRRLLVRTADDAQDPRQYHLLYIGNVAERPLAALLARVDGAPVLTVGDHERFTQLGGIIRLFSDNDHVRFEVNAARAAKSRLKISSRVLNLARIVRETE